MKRLGIMFFAVILFINIQDTFGQNNRLNTNNDIEQDI